MKHTATQYPTISIIILFAIVTSLVSFRTTPSSNLQCPSQIMPPRATRSTQEAARRRQDNEAMAAAILQKEKNAAKKDELNAANGDNLIVAGNTNPTQVPLPSVVSPPSAPNLTSLLTGHVGQCDNIHSWISLSGDLAFSHQGEIYGFKFPKRFLEISSRDLTLFSILII